MHSLGEESFATLAPHLHCWRCAMDGYVHTLHSPHEIPSWDADMH